MLDPMLQRVLLRVLAAGSRWSFRSRVTEPSDLVFRTSRCGTCYVGALTHEAPDTMAKVLHTAAGAGSDLLKEKHPELCSNTSSILRENATVTLANF